MYCISVLFCSNRSALRAAEERFRHVHHHHSEGGSRFASDTVRPSRRTIQNGVQTTLKLKNRSLRAGEDFSSENHRDGDLALKFPHLHRSGLERREEKEE